jgi:hypothetical protein
MKCGHFSLTSFHHVLILLDLSATQKLTFTFLARIREQLGPTYEFVFLDGEVECDAAPGQFAISSSDLRSFQRLCLMHTDTFPRRFSDISWPVPRLVSRNTVRV